MTDWLSPNPFQENPRTDVFVYFDENQLDQQEVEKALDPTGRSERIGAGTDLVTGLRDVQYRYSSRATAQKAAQRVRNLARRHRAKVGIRID